MFERTSVHLIIPVALAGLLGGCAAKPMESEGTGFVTGPTTASAVVIDLPDEIAKDGEIVIPAGKGVLLRIPSTGKDAFGVLLGTTAKDADGRAIVTELASTYSGDPGGVGVQLVSGWGYFFSYGYRPRARGPRIAPVGSGTEFIFWVDAGGTEDTADDIERVFLIKSDSFFDGDKVHVTRLGMPETKKTLTKARQYAVFAKGDSEIAVDPKPLKDDMDLVEFVKQVEAAAKAYGLEWTMTLPDG